MKPEPTKRNFSIRLPQEVIELLDEIAENTGLNITRNNVVEQACEWYVRTYRANGDRAMTKSDFESLIEFIQGKEHPQPHKGGASAQNLAGVKIQKASQNFDSSSSTATKKNYRRAG